MGKFKDALVRQIESQRLIARAEAANRECPDCGGLGGAMERDDEYGEMWVPCKACLDRIQDADVEWQEEQGL